MSEPSWHPPPRYINYRKIAEGGTAIVSLVWDTVEEQWRAIKTLQRDYAKRPALRNRFEREGHTMTTLDHPNVIRVYDAVADDDGAYLVMEYAEGGSVIDWLERHGAMPARMAADIALQLCRGIAAAHAQGIIHRDIKPQNLVVDRNGTVKVTDFGIAQATKEPRLTLTGTVMGTVGYMAPEQSESAKHADERADIYSIAATLYTLVRGAAPTHLFMAEEEEYEGVPPVLAQVIRRGGEYRREARFPTVDDMADALEHALYVLPPDPPDTPPLLPPYMELTDDLVPPEEGEPPPVPPPLAATPLPERRRGGNTDIAELLPRPAFQPPPQTRRLIDVRPDRRAIERRDRNRRLAQWSVGLSILTVLLLSATAFVGQTNVDRAKTRIEVAEQDLEKSVRDHSGLPDRLARVNSDEMPGVLEDLFDRIPIETDRNRRDGAISRLVAALDQTLRDLDRSNAIGLEAAQRATESALKNIRERHVRYMENVDDCRLLESGLPARLARAVPGLGGRCLTEAIERP
jgi:serine/threonine protein kinase